MTKTVIDIDDDVLRKVSELLGTTTKKDTVNDGLRELLRLKAVARHIESLRSGRYADLLDPEVMKNAWR